MKDSDKKVKGTISIPNLSEENEIEEVDVSYHQHNYSLILMTLLV